MVWHHSLYGNILLGSSLLSLFVAYYTWKKRFLPGNRYFIIIMVSAFVWTLTGALEAYSPTPEQKTFWSQISYFGIVNTSPAWFCFALHFSGYSQYITRKRIALLWILPVLFVTAAMTNNYHHLIWTKTELVSNPLGLFIEYYHGPIFWVMVVYLYILNLAATFVLLRQVRSHYRLYQQQSIAVLLSALFPWIGNIIYNFRLAIPSFDPTPIAFTFSGVALIWGVMRHRLFNVAPIARDVLFSTMHELVIVLDIHHRILDMNTSAMKTLGITKPPLGIYYEQALEQWKDIVLFVASKEKSAVIAFTRSDGCVQWFKISNSVLEDKRKNATGFLLVCHDITEQKRAEQERETLIMELMDSIANVKTLTGLLPICTNCKKIRDDAGYWQQVETYVAKHTEASFTHGVCPDCIEKLYGAYFKKLQQ